MPLGSWISNSGPRVWAESERHGAVIGRIIIMRFSHFLQIM